MLDVRYSTKTPICSDCKPRRAQGTFDRLRLSEVLLLIPPG